VIAKEEGVAAFWKGNLMIIIVDQLIVIDSNIYIFYIIYIQVLVQLGYVKLLTHLFVLVCTVPSNML
jgi:hypothetical protein